MVAQLLPVRMVPVLVPATAHHKGTVAEVEPVIAPLHHLMLLRGQGTKPILALTREWEAVGTEVLLLLVVGMGRAIRATEAQQEVRLTMLHPVTDLRVRLAATVKEVAQVATVALELMGAETTPLRHLHPVAHTVPIAVTEVARRELVTLRATPTTAQEVPGMDLLAVMALVLYQDMDPHQCPAPTPQHPQLRAIPTLAQVVATATLRVQEADILLPPDMAQLPLLVDHQPLAIQFLHLVYILVATHLAVAVPMEVRAAVVPEATPRAPLVVFMHLLVNYLMQPDPATAPQQPLQATITEAPRPIPTVLKNRSLPTTLQALR